MANMDPTWIKETLSTGLHSFLETLGITDPFLASSSFQRLPTLLGKWPLPFSKQDTLDLSEHSSMFSSNCDLVQAPTPHLTIGQ